MKRLTYILACVLLAGLSQAGTAYTLTNGGATAWATTGNWNPNGNPGLASGDTAALTNSAMIGTNTISVTPANSLTSITLSNATGYMLLDVTNCTLNTSTLNMYNGGRIQIDNGGVLTNTTLNVSGSNVTVALNAGGQWNDSSTSIADPGVNVGLNVYGAGTWSLGGNTFYWGNGTGTLTVSGVTMTNLAGTFCCGNGGTANSIVLSNGASLYTGSGLTKIGISTSGNAIQLGGNGSSTVVKTTTIYAGANAGDQNNIVNITNATVTSGGINVGNATAQTNNQLNIYSGGVFNSSAASTVGYGAASSYNQVNIYSNGLFQGNVVHVGNAASIGNSFNIFPGGAATNIALTVGSATGGPSNSVSVVGGTLLMGATGMQIGSLCNYNSFYASNAILQGLLTVGYGAPAYSNSAKVIGGNWNMNNVALWVAVASSAGNNFNTFNASGAVITNCSRVVVAGSLGGASAQNWNTAIFSNGCYLQVNAGFQIQPGYNAGCTGNVIQLGGNGSQTIVTNSGALTVGNFAGCVSNMVVVTNCMLYQNAAIAIASANTEQYNSIQILAGGVVNAGNQTVAIAAAGGSNNMLLVNGGIVTNVGLITMGANANSISNSIIVINGTLAGATNAAGYVIDGQYSTFYANNAVLAGILTLGNNGYNSNTATIIGSTWNAGNQNIAAGGTAGATYGNSINISASSITNINRLICSQGSSPNDNNSLIVSNGSFISAVDVYCALNNAGKSNLMQLGGYGAPSVVSNTASSLGNNAGTVANTLTVTNATFYCTTLSVGGISGTNDMCNINAGGSIVCSTSFTEGHDASTVSNVTYITPGGILDSPAITCVNGISNYIVNAGGTYQFNLWNPSITPGTFGAIQLNNGTVTFRNCTNVDIQCNYTAAGKSLRSDTLMSFSGINGFYMNGATNQTTGQAYTFSANYGATNWASLGLANGALWQGGNITIGSGGSLGGSGTISSNLTLAAGSTTFANTDGSYITLGTNATLGGTLTIPAGFSVPSLGMIIFSNKAGVASGSFATIPTNTSVSISGGLVKLNPASTINPTLMLLLRRHH